MTGSAGTDSSSWKEALAMEERFEKFIGKKHRYPFLITSKLLPEFLGQFSLFQEGSHDKVGAEYAID